MEKITLVLGFDEQLSLSELSRTLFEFNRMVNLTSRLDEELKENLLKLDEFADNEVTLIIEQLKQTNRGFNRNRPQVEIQNISMNSPLEMIINADIAIHIAIILLGGERRDLYHYTIPRGLLSYAYEFWRKSRNSR
jgi:hypothetical protein